MRILTMFAATLSLSACATAVADSLDRRGVDAKSMLIERVTEARGDAVRAKTSFDQAGAALEAISGLDGAALARQVDTVRAAGQNAALAAQDVRLSSDTVSAAAARFFREKEEELALFKTSDAARAAAEQTLAANAAAHRAYASSLDAVALRLSPALSLIDAEASALRRNPTSAVAAAARTDARAAAIAAARDASDGLGAMIDAADAFTDKIK